MPAFGDRVIERTRALRHPLCVGLDPYLDRIPSLFRRGSMQPQHPDTAQAVKEFCCRVIDLIAADVAVVKPQASLFERLGMAGVACAGTGDPIRAGCGLAGFAGREAW